MQRVNGPVPVRPAALAGAHFPVVVVGAGINGVGVFRDLCAQGVACLVVDKGDFGSGASSAPSRMIHGGLRYLESGDFALVAEAVRERNLLLRNAPHMVRPLRTVIPLSSRLGGLLAGGLRFFGRAPAPVQRGLVVVALGLMLYDLLGRRDRPLPGHRIDRLDARDQALFRPSVRWAATYYDAWIRHPEWLVLELIADAQRDEPRSRAANYCQVVACEGNVLTLRDEIGGEEVRVTADVVVNATGAWLDRSAQALAGQGARILGTKGSHLVLDHPALRDALAGRMAYFEAPDGRVCIVYPFLDRVLVGSTDIPVEDPDEVVTEAAEIEYLIGVLRELFPAQRFERGQVLYTYVGVRPLARSNNVQEPGRISRDHAVALDAPNGARSIPLVCLVGGKWTTFRALAAEAADLVLQQLKRTRKRSTQPLAIGGGAGWPADAASMARLQAGIEASSGLAAARVRELLERYGTCAAALAQQFAAEGDEPLRHAPGHTVAEIRHLCVRTGVQRLSDIVLRRTLLAIRGQVTGDLLAELADVAAGALAWSPARRDRELRMCIAVLREHHHARIAEACAAEPGDFEASSPLAPLLPQVTP
jgi:glycerol-3-phosphate dehydrogenase